MLFVHYIYMYMVAFGMFDIFRYSCIYYKLPFYMYEITLKTQDANGTGPSGPGRRNA